MTGKKCTPLLQNALSAISAFSTENSLTDLHLIHIEDNPADHELVMRTLDRHELPCRVTWVDTLDDFEEVFNRSQVDAVLADYHLAGFSGMEAWEWLSEQSRTLPFILVSGAIGEAAVADAMIRGVSDYVDKHHLQRLPMVLRRSIEFHEARRAQVQARQALEESQRRLLSLTEHLQLSIDRERADIAREIHDDIGGALAAVKLDMSWLSRRLHDEEAQRHVQAGLAMVEHALGASQRIMRNLRPAVLDQGLLPALEWLTQTFADRSGLNVRLNGRLHHEMSPDKAMVVYRTAQEALTNILKHAGARDVHLDISDMEDVLTLEISDNGRGASADDLAKVQSFGLLGLKERAHNVGGWLDVATEPGHGMTLILSIPLTGGAPVKPWETAE